MQMLRPVSSLRGLNIMFFNLENSQLLIKVDCINKLLQT